MEGHIVLKKLLDDLCDTKELKSWTVHQNNNSTVCTLRFHEAAAILDLSDNSNSQQKTIAYKRKSTSQINRDKSRLDKFRRQNSHHNLRPEVETLRCDNQSSDLYSKPGLTQDPEYSSVLSATASLFHMSEHSTDQLYEASSIESICSEPSPELNMPELNVPSSVNVVPASHSDCNAEILINFTDFDNDNIATVMNNDLRDISNTVPPYYNAESGDCSDILCSVCDALAPFNTNMLHCEKCNYHICGSCVVSPYNKHSVTCCATLVYLKPELKAAAMHHEPPDMNSQIVSELMEGFIEIMRTTNVFK